MKVDPNVKISSFPLLGIKRPLALLKPCVLEKFERGEEHGYSPEAILFSGTMPVFGSRDKGACQLRVIPLWTDQIDQRLGK